MPAAPRNQIVAADEVGIYHCYNRCVRRAFLCGLDAVSGRNFDHRKQWIRSRLELFASAFAIEICDFAVLDNHFHVILRNRPDIARTLSDREVALRWWRLCATRRNERGEAAEDPRPCELNEWLDDPEKMAELRVRLCSISWFMRLMCQKIARMANEEDKTAGKFWESRFRSQALLDDEAILTCSMYVDLNAIRAGKADTPEESEFTSVYERIAAWRTRIFGSNATDSATTHAEACAAISDGNSAETLSADPAESSLWLIPIELSARDSAPAPGSTQDTSGAVMSQVNPFPSRRLSDKGFLPMSLEHYLKLLDWAGRQIRSDKRGSIPTDLAPIMDRLRINPTAWLNLLCDFPKSYRTALGRADSLAKFGQRLGRRWISGVRQAAVAFR